MGLLGFYFSKRTSEGGCIRRNLEHAGAFLPTGRYGHCSMAKCDHLLQDMVAIKISNLHNQDRCVPVFKLYDRFNIVEVVQCLFPPVYNHRQGGYVVTPVHFIVWFCGLFVSRIVQNLQNRVPQNVVEGWETGQEKSNSFLTWNWTKTWIQESFTTFFNNVRYGVLGHFHRCCRE